LTAPSYSERSGTPAEVQQGTRPDSAWLEAPFRASRSLPAKAYTPELAQALEAEAADEAARHAEAQAATEAAAQHEAQRPPWVLVGVILGNPPVAIFGQVLNRSGGAVLSLGDQVDGFVVSRIDADSVLVAREGQSWAFDVTPPWR
jgi:hypothetical protein